MEKDFRLTSSEYAKMRGLSVEALRSRRRRELERDNFICIDGKYWWKNDRPITVNKNVNNRLNRGPSSPLPAPRVRRRGALIKGQETNYHNAVNGWQLEEHNLVKHLAKIRYDKGDKLVDEITPEVIKIAKKNLDEKNRIEAEKTLTKNPYGTDLGPGIPYGVDRTDPKYGTQLTAKGIQKQDDDYHRRKAYLWNYKTSVKFYEDTTTPYFGDYSNGVRFGNFGQKEREEQGSVEIDPRDFTPDDREPEFRNKIEESIYRLKKNK